MTDYKYGGARTLILLHEQRLKSFLATWSKAATIGVELPETDDSAYESMHALLRHVLACARGYMIWCCGALELPDPDIPPVPEVDQLPSQLDSYVHVLLTKWRSPLASVPEQSFHQPEHESWWGVRYCVDAMLEHAVMHPLRHEFQLLERLSDENVS